MPLLPDDQSRSVRAGARHHLGGTGVERAFVEERLAAGDHTIYNHCQERTSFAADWFSGRAFRVFGVFGVIGG
ncbi:hypothetical protein DMA12_43150 [Amycolatopsis balhimycina DSM 5908]|uniref:Uncharacterized protein n=1 Tax=Amycolatopsis balhimycina DSM 5908 TaxID=1081091 RepID=A0A428VY38_AMYBA|nr:hypothetical protein [Amycolatopsis balhimycina]RSM35718.1 hypothetical protein DMA12_43150 [Amycolatopsis balhimycina DSM 5908]